MPRQFAFLADAGALRRRFVLSEILGPPRALRKGIRNGATGLSGSRPGRR